MTRIMAIIAAILVCFSALAVEPDEILSDQVLETRARAISLNLRCLVCQNQSIDDSDAELAADLRVLVRERLVAGDSDTEVLDYVVARYGEFVLLKPVWAMHTLVLWVAAPLILFLGLIALFVTSRGRQTPSQAKPMTAKEKAALAALVGEDAKP